ncbi:MAG: molybdenum cofactor biosynthesis protein [Moraxellaceae bacterium]|jgi:molybdenum cofactor biosynthesis protein B|nr:molybdenum cofactor biosynthesis protein [Moraxellaceae bacterium]
MTHAAADALFISLPIAVLTVSDTRDLGSDTSGASLAEVLQAAGHELADRRIVKDDIYAIRATVSAWIADAEIAVILITGGTGFSGRDSTPEAVRVLFDKTVEGFGELFRQVSLAEIGTSTIQSRALAGLANRTLICCLPGSNNACRTAWQKIIEPQLDNRTRPCNFVPQLKPTARCPSRTENPEEPA